MANSHGDEKFIAELRLHYASFTNADLLGESVRWTPHSAQSIAARQELQEREDAERSKQHQETLEQERQLHAKTQCIAKWGLGVGIGALLVGLVAFARDWFPEVFRPTAVITAPSAGGKT